jgi:hypothetical protein
MAKNAFRDFAIFSLTLGEIKSTAGRETFSDLQLLFTLVHEFTICTFCTFHPGFREHLLHYFSL